MLARRASPLTTQSGPSRLRPKRRRLAESRTVALEYRPAAGDLRCAYTRHRDNGPATHDFPADGAERREWPDPGPGELTAAASERGEFRKRRLQPRLIDLAKLAVVQVDEDPGVDPAQQIGIAAPHADGVIELRFHVVLHLEMLVREALVQHKRAVVHGRQTVDLPGCKCR